MRSIPFALTIRGLSDLKLLQGTADRHHNSSVASLAFISYRRSDSQQAALGLYSQLRARLGVGSAFLDRSGISGGDVWPERLHQELNKSSILLALIGPYWLISADKYGRRRLDQADDWVRNEIESAIRSRKPIIPILLGPATTMPPAEALPDGLVPLTYFQAYSLREDHWDRDLDELAGLLIDQHGFRASESKVRLPEPRVTLAPLTQEELEAALKGLPHWEPVESFVPGDYPRSRQELRKAFSFRSFRAAIEFMNSAIVPIQKVKHHPRWENQWLTVTVYLSTWDIGYRLSRLDIELAKVLDRVYEESPATRSG